MRESSNPTRKRGPNGEDLEYPCRGCGEIFFGPKARGAHERNWYCKQKIKAAQQDGVRIRACYQIAASEVETAFRPEDVSYIETARRLVRARLRLPDSASLWCAVVDSGPRKELYYYELSQEDPFFT